MSDDGYDWQRSNAERDAKYQDPEFLIREAERLLATAERFKATAAETAERLPGHSSIAKNEQGERTFRGRASYLLRRAEELLASAADDDPEV